LVEALRSGILTSDHERDAVGFRHALLREATSRETGPGARRSWHRRWAEVLEDNPGVLAADPALLAIAEHWHQAGDVRRALAATAAAMPAAGRICRPDEEVALWARVMRGYATVDDADQVTGLSLREAYARSALSMGVASLAAEREWIDAVPDGLLTEPVRRFHALRRVVHGKGEANAYADDELLAISSAVDEEEDDLLAVMVRAFTGSNLTEHTERGDELIARAWTDARRLGDTRVAFMVAAVESYRAQVLGDPEGAAARLREVLDEIGDTTWPGVFHLWGNLAWCEVVCGNHERADAAVTEGLSRLRRPHLSVNVWEHLVENATATWMLGGQWARARDLFEASGPWWEDDVRTSNARHDLLDLQQRGTADLERWRAHLGSPAPGGAAVCLIRELLGVDAAARGDLRAMRAVIRPLWAGDRLTLDDDQLWYTAVLAARAEADAALVGPRDHGAEAREHLSEVEAASAQFRRFGRLGEVWPLDLAAQLDRFHGRDARQALRAALEGWESIGHVPDVAITHLSLAEQEAIQGDRDRARHHLAAGRAVAERLEARPMLARADALAQTYGLAARERRTNGVLTEREIEVLRLVADGMTNGQIGGRLFMAPKTASVHVSHILAKLGAANRTEAAATARRQGLLD
jgi:DNA-binding CsgD family transcriptional regulator